MWIEWLIAYIMLFNHSFNQSLLQQMCPYPVDITDVTTGRLYSSIDYMHMHMQLYRDIQVRTNSITGESA